MLTILPYEWMFILTGKAIRKHVAVVEVEEVRFALHIPQQAT